MSSPLHPPDSHDERTCTPPYLHLERQGDGSVVVLYSGRWVCRAAPGILEARGHGLFSGVGAVRRFTQGALRFHANANLRMPEGLERLFSSRWGHWSLQVERQDTWRAPSSLQVPDYGTLLWLGRFLAAETGWTLCEESAADLLRAAMRRALDAGSAERLQAFLGEPRSIGVLVEILHEPGREWQVVQNRLPECITASLVPLLEAVRRLLAAPEHPDQEAAAELLDLLQCPDADRLLSELLRHPNLKVRRTAITRLSQFDSQTRESVRRAAADPDPTVAGYAAAILGELRDAEAFPALCAALQYPAASVQDAAARSLGKLGDTAAVPHLCQAFDCLTPAQKGGVLATTLVEMLGGLGGPETVLTLADALQSASPEIREQAAKYLARPYAADARPALIRTLLQDPVPQVAAAAAESLHRIGGMEASEALVQALSHPSWEVRLQAAGGLEELGNAEAAAALCRALTDIYPEVRAAASSALLRIARRSPEEIHRLRGAIPALRHLAGLWSGEGTAARAIHKQALAQIDGAATQVDNLPVPASDLDTRREELPVPANPAATLHTDLPLSVDLHPDQQN